ncbi:MAG TPA: Gfo/Idh/MocA family oxidoreductase [Terracidiphilus sp.]|nr:Gfo/Idh/MocA family oxidoreductase [Terracidiphilus sp.]
MTNRVSASDEDASLATSSLPPLTKTIRVGMVGLGRMGMIHALHLHELEEEGDLCQLTCVSTRDREAADAFLSLSHAAMPVFDDIDGLVKSDLCDVAVIATNTPLHREHALKLISAGHRVFLEKPLTGTLEGDSEFAELLEREHPEALMLGFQRRFDEPTIYAKNLIDRGTIGRIFKIYSALEDSGPAPNGFASPGILADMAVHNVDEVVWFTGRKPQRALAVGSRIFSHRLTTCDEDFDDGLMLLDFGDELISQIQVSRNHVSGYRGETVIYGEKGLIRIGCFRQKLLEVTVEAYGARAEKEPIALKNFVMRRYDQPLPEFIDRYGAAYKEELRTFLMCCRNGEAFPITHRDGLLAQEIVAGAMKASITQNEMGPIEYLELDKRSAR